MKTIQYLLWISLAFTFCHAKEFQISMREYGSCQTDPYLKMDFQYHLGINRPYCQYHSDCQDLWFRYTCRFPTVIEERPICVKDENTQQSFLSHAYYATTEDAVPYVENKLGAYPEWAYGRGSLHTKVQDGDTILAPDCGNQASITVIYYKAGCYGDKLDIVVDGEPKDWNVNGANALMGDSEASTENIQKASSDDLCKEDEEDDDECMIDVFQGKPMSNRTSGPATDGTTDGKMDVAREACSDVWTYQAILAASSSNRKLGSAVCTVVLLAGFSVLRG